MWARRAVALLALYLIALALAGWLLPAAWAAWGSAVAAFAVLLTAQPFIALGVLKPAEIGLTAPRPGTMRVVVLAVGLALLLNVVVMIVRGAAPVRVARGHGRGRARRGRARGTRVPRRAAGPARSRAAAALAHRRRVHRLGRRRADGCPSSRCTDCGPACCSACCRRPCYTSGCANAPAACWRRSPRTSPGISPSCSSTERPPRTHRPPCHASSNRSRCAASRCPTASSCRRCASTRPSTAARRTGTSRTSARSRCPAPGCCAWRRRR